MARRPNSCPPGLAAGLGLPALLMALACPAAAEGTVADAMRATSAPATRPVLRLKPRTPELALELRTLPAEPLLQDEAPVLPATRTDRMKRAFEAELREEAIRSRRAALYATIPLEFPELLEDDYIRKQQARVAESVLGDALEAAVTEGFFHGRFHEQKLTIRPMFATAEHGLRVDASPSWTYRIRAPRGGFRVDVPLTPSAVRVHAFRDLKGTDRTPLRLGAGVLLDPFDSEIRCGVSFQF